MSTSAPVVTIRQGRVRGTSDGTVAAFRGIPFAASPVAELRFRPPEPDPGWSGVLDGTRPGPAVPQGRSRLASVMGDGDEGWDEDGCLNLNVWAPESALDGRSPRPVLVWFPVLGGAGFPLAWPEAVALGRLGGRPVLIGRTSDEITAFLAMSPSLASLAAEGDAGALAAATEQQFGAGITAIAVACAAQGAPARVYRFTRVSAAVPALAATHCSDLPFAFDNLGAYAGAPMLGPVDDRDRALARSLAAALAGFAAGDEAEGGWTRWQADRDVRYF